MKVVHRLRLIFLSCLLTVGLHLDAIAQPAPPAATHGAGAIAQPAAPAATHGAGATVQPAPPGATHGAGPIAQPAPSGATHAAGATAQPAPSGATHAPGSNRAAAKEPGSTIPAVLLYPAAWILFLLALYGIRPLWLLWISRLLVEPLAETSFGGFKLKPGADLLCLTLHRRSRVLNAFVKKYLPVAEGQFNARATVSERQLYVPLSVGLPQIIDSFRQPRTTVLIHGDGGIGKTTLACQTAAWGMAPDGAKVAPMLPVLIESDLAGGEALQTRVLRQLQELIAESRLPSNGLVEELLREGRLLLIVDGLSERDGNTLQEVKNSRHAIARLLLTSRGDEQELLKEFPGVVRLEPPRLRGADLFQFVENYLTAKKGQYKFSDDELFEVCDQLLDTAGDREITPLLAKLYIEMLIAGKDGLSTKDLPANVPDLMVSYVDKVSGNAGYDTAGKIRVREAMKQVGRLCLAPRFQPDSASRTEIEEALRGAGLPDTILSELEKMRLVVAVDQEKKKLKIVMDPLAEYMAALSLLDECGTDERQWRTFLDRVKENTTEIANIRGFLLAVRDCCLRENLTDVAAELARKTSSDLVLEVRSRFQRRLDFQEVLLKTGAADVRRKAARRLGEAGLLPDDTVSLLIEALHDTDPDVREEVVSALGQSRSALAETGVAIAGALKDPSIEVQRAAAKALPKVRITPELMPAVIDGLNNDDREVRLPLLRALAEHGEDALSALPALDSILKSQTGELLITAAQAYWEISRQKDLPIQAVLRSLVDSDTSVRKKAAELFKKLGANQESVPALMLASKNHLPGVRATAAQLFCQMGEEARPAVPFLKDLLKDKDGQTKVWAATALWRLDEEPKHALSLIIDATRNPEATTRELAIEILGSIGSQESQVDPALAGLLTSQDARDRVQSARALVKIRGKGGPLIPILVEATRNPDLEVRLRAVRTLGELREEGAGFTAALMERARIDPSQSVRFQAVLHLPYLKPPSEPVVDCLMEVCEKEPDAIVRQWAAYGLGKMGARRAEPVLKKLLADSDLSVRVRAAAALTGRGRAESDELRVLIGGVLRGGEYDRSAALEAIQALGREARSVVPLLIEALKDTSSSVREAAIEALGEMGPEALTASEMLIDDAQHHPKPLVRLAALKTLPRIGLPASDLLQVAMACAKDEYRPARNVAIRILGDFGDQAPIVVPLLTQMIKDHAAPDYSYAIESLEEIGGPAIDSLPRLIDFAGRGRQYRCSTDTGEIRDLKDCL